MLTPGTCFPGRAFPCCGFAGLYNNFECMSYSDILFRSLSLTIYTCIMICLVSQAETVWVFIFCFCWFTVFESYISFLTHNVILWDRDEDRVFGHLNLLLQQPAHLRSERCSVFLRRLSSSAKINWNTKPSLQLQPLLLFVNSPAAPFSLVSLQGHKPQVIEAGIIKGVHLFCIDRSTAPEATHTYF